MRALLIAVMAIILSGCATLSKEECLYADWYQIGYEDGSKGKDVLTLSRHRKACAKAGVTPDRKAYAKGHEEGLFRYCTYSKGLAIGTGGGNKPNFCPAPTRIDFDLGYAHGIERFQKQQVINGIAADVNSIEAQILDYENLLVHYEVVITGEDSSAEERSHALVELRNTENSINLLRREMVLAQEALAIEQDKLRHIISRQQ